MKQPASRAAVAAPSSSLGETALRNGRRFGAAVRLKNIEYDQGFQDLVLKQCNELTPELALRWSDIEPERGQLSVSVLDGICEFASEHAKMVRGHSLLWENSVPAWANGILTRGDWLPIHGYFSSIIPRYGGLIHEWDVINEPIETGKREDGLRENVFLRSFGPGYIIRALQNARLFAPHAKLMINEYGLDYDIPVERDRRYHFLKLLERTLRAGAPLDGVGIQGHLDLGKSPFVPKVFSDFLKSIREMGLFIAITELDVKEFDYVLPMKDRDKRVGNLVRRYLNTALADPAVKSVTTWGLSDLYSWLEVTPEDYARYPNAWKTGPGPGLNRGLPFDSSFRPKPMDEAIADAFRRHSLA